jgi:hypothetical protein
MKRMVELFEKHWLLLAYQIALVIWGVYAWQRTRPKRHRRVIAASEAGGVLGSGSAPHSVVRSDRSWGYLIFSVMVLVGLYISAVRLYDISNNAKILLGAVDTAIILYVCLWNQWSRGLIIGLLDRIRRRERDG